MCHCKTTAVARAVALTLPLRRLLTRRNRPEAHFSHNTHVKLNTLTLRKLLLSALDPHVGSLAAIPRASRALQINHRAVLARRIHGPAIVVSNLLLALFDGAEDERWQVSLRERWVYKCSLGQNLSACASHPVPLVGVGGYGYVNHDGPPPPSCIVWAFGRPAESDLGARGNPGRLLRASSIFWPPDRPIKV